MQSLQRPQTSIIVRQTYILEPLNFSLDASYAIKADTNALLFPNSYIMLQNNICACGKIHAYLQKCDKQSINSDYHRKIYCDSSHPTLIDTIVNKSMIKKIKKKNKQKFHILGKELEQCRSIRQIAGQTQTRTIDHTLWPISGYVYQHKF